MYKPVIGLEIHAELKTQTKMFCDSLNDPDEKHPNINVCPICVGHPGTLRAGLMKGRAPVVKIHGTGELTKAFSVKGCAVSVSARAAITAVGGTIHV
ncbi:MAG: aspartyl-tRNA(Asn)/glutamyl-tRNA (Gln) amidotransferase subunit B [Parcubacteria group bacterium Gr01-1014_91]|nr:MAG: aspartyl-tRNA(Asn)/glutamyl-tRNA (Gln) amidotransferase subunit B [Parcubacteria group bacterium Gr01-1014_91]